MPVRTSPTGSRCRTLCVELLEDRRVLAAVLVGNNLDTVNGDVSSIATLEAMPGGDGISIREAIEAANNTPGADEITFDFGHDGPEVITLTEGELQVSDALSISGDGPALLTIDAGNGSDGLFNTQDGHRVFLIDDEDELSSIQVSISGMTLTGGDLDFAVDADEDSGGAILNREDLTISESSISGNAAGNFGGGVCNYYGTLAITDSTITGNAARRGAGVGNFYVGDVHVANSIVSNNYGLGIFNLGRATIENSEINENNEGGIFNEVDGIVNVSTSSISGNTIDGHGGGIRNRGVATVTESSIVGNTADGDGGGIANGSSCSCDDDAMISIVDSTISGNAASTGGGVYNRGAATIHTSTISSNSANLGGGNGNGGGIFSGRDSTLLVTHSTIANNWANSGGGIHNSYAQGVAIHHTVVARNVSNFGDVYRSAAGSYNLIGDGTFLQGIKDGVDGNQVGTQQNPIDPLIGPLADHGGPTKTHALLPGSLAIDMGDPTIQFNENEFDQRGEGYYRVADGDVLTVIVIDIGAYESQGIPDYPLGDYNHDGVANIADYTVWRDTLGSTTDLRANGDNTGASENLIDAADYAFWKAYFGNTTIPLNTPLASAQAMVDAVFATFESSVDAISNTQSDGRTSSHALTTTDDIDLLLLDRAANDQLRRQKSASIAEQPAGNDSPKLTLAMNWETVAER